MGNFDLSVGYFKEGKFDLALKEINACIKEDKKNAELYFFRARVHSRLGNFELSLEDFDYLTQLEPFNPSFISDRAVVLHLLKRNEEAATEFDRALNLEPSNPYRYSSRAYFRDRIGDFQGAIDDYTKAIEMDPEDAVSYNNRGLVEEKMGYMSRAKKSFEIADDLVGYKSSQQTKAKSADTSEKNKATFSMPKQENAASKLSLDGYFNVFKKIFTDKSTWSEFVDFIGSGFKTKTPRDS
ncbi:tetratricopeptide repeat protein [Belliella baltica DSM 15883]|uniref:Tetratricopeptide repeat protein n=1 Tax=Belliella baltica (strain DSM 15883 / CIP 108006 / LMG 21964 / BA134) TaxID=866536 RepID=I3Z8H6_BELBD|nr:tetratricopeptide repeat protein [Belliella baltica]AFL85544.1 tetratricopeptide repeat protein [Belliella baltica DSM 15883]